MKKFAFLLIFFSFLGSAVWGQGTTYTWTGQSVTDPTDWNDPDNWDNGTGYPGQTPSDIAVFDGNASVNISASITLAKLEIDTGVNLTLNTVAGTLTVTELVINGGLALTGTMDITDLTAGAGGELDVTAGTVSIGGGTIDKLDANDLEISEVSGIVGDIDVDTRDVSIALNNATTAVTLGTIATAVGKTISLTLDGTRNFDGGATNNFNAVTIKSGAVITIIVNDLTCSTLNNNGTLNLGTHNITGAINNIGKLTLEGNANQITPAVTTMGGTVEFNGTGATLSGITDFTNLTITSGNRSVTTPVTVSGAANIGANVTTGGNQTYTGAFTLTATTVTLDAGTSTVSFGSTVTGAGTHDLAITGNAVFNGAVTVNSLSVSLETEIGANITTTTTQTYSGDVTLGAAAVSPVTLTGTTVTLGAITGGGKDLTVDASVNAVFNEVSNTGIKDLKVTGNMVISKNATSIITSGDQSYNAINLSTNNVTLTSTGSKIEATGVVSGTGDLSVNSASGINFSAANNNVSGNISLNKTGTSAGAIVYNSSRGTGSNLIITAVNNASTGGDITITEATGNITIPTGAPSISTNTQLGVVTITATLGSITVSGGIGNGNGDVRLISVVSTSGITVSNAINCYRLTLDADGVGTVAVNNSITVSSTNKTNHYDTNPAANLNAAVYINANIFSGTGNINLAGTSPNIGWVCVDFSSNSYTGTATNIHYHPDKNKHIVYRNGTDPTGLLGALQYTYIRADDPTWDNPLNLSASGTNNFYIIDVTSDSRDISFGTVNGAIEIRGTFSSSGIVDLNAGTGGIILNGAAIDLSGDSFYTNGAKIELLNSHSTIESTYDILINDITTISGTQNLTLTANNITIVGTGTASTINGNLTITNSGIFTLAAGSAITLTNGNFTQTDTGGSTTLAGSITTTGTGTISFADLVTVNGIANLTTAGGNITFADKIKGEDVNVTSNHPPFVPVGELTLNAGGAGLIKIDHQIGNPPAAGKAAYLKKFHVVSTGLTLSTGADIYAQEMIFNQDFITGTTDYFKLAVPDASGGSVKIDNKLGGNFILSGGTYDPTQHGLNALEFTQLSGSNFDHLLIAPSSYIRVKDQLSYVDGDTLILSAGIKPTLARPYTATTLDLTVMASVSNWVSTNKLILQGSSKEESSRVIFSDNMGTFLNQIDYKVENPVAPSEVGWAYLQSLGSTVNINSITDTDKIANPQIIMEMQEGTVTPKTLLSNYPIGSLHIYAETNLGTDLIVNGELVINQSKTAKGSLNAGSHDITMQAGLTGKRNITEYTHAPDNPVKYARWEVVTHAPLNGNNLPTTMTIFKQDPGKKVIFKRATGLLEDTNLPVFFEIVGNTMWQDFECMVPGATIQFSSATADSVYQVNPTPNLNHLDHHIFLGEFKVQGGTGAGQRITLTRLLDDTSSRYKHKPGTVPPGASGGTLDSSLPSHPAAKNLKSDPERFKFWNFNYMDSATEAIENTEIYFSHAWYQRVPLLKPNSLFILPYFRLDAPLSHFNYEWGIEYHTIIYSFAEDANGNGKVDRIRVQSNVVLNNDFSLFAATVDGYGIDTSEGINGYQLVKDKLSSANPDDEKEFYIYLKEQPYIYDGKPLTWKVVSNSSLKDKVTESYIIGDYKGSFDLSYKTINTIPPRISYAVTLPGHSETFFSFTQPMNSSISGIINDIPAGIPAETSETYEEVLEYLGEVTKEYKVSIPSGAIGYSFAHGYQPPPSVVDLAKLQSNNDGVNSPAFYFKAKGFTGLSVPALDWNDDKVDPLLYIHYPSPRYPVDWNYSEYKKWVGNGYLKRLGFDLADDDPNNPLKTDIFVPPYKALTPGAIRNLLNNVPVEPSDLENPADPADLIRRSTDILVSMAPLSGDADNYFAWPVWARYAGSPGSADEDITVIWDFDGSKYLEARGDIDMHAQMNNLFSGTLDLFWTNKIGTDFRLRGEEPTRGKNTGGLWQPNLTVLGEDDTLYNIPQKLASLSNQVKLRSAAAIPGAKTQLFDFTFTGDMESRDKLEFVFRIKDDGNKNPVNPDMFIACLDIPRGAAIPSDWYKRVRPFSFDIQDVRLQRGGVTILNNVINSEKREITQIRYNLVRPGRVTIQVYTLDGSLVKSIRRNEQRDIGIWTDVWDGTNNGGRSVARGMYFIRVVGPDIDEIRKVMVVK